MKRLFCIILFLILICSVFTSCSKQPTPSADGSEAGTISTETQQATDEETEQTTPPAQESVYESSSYTLMIYMCGSNLETTGGYATKNIAEMLTADIPEKTKVIIQTGGSKKWRDYDISPDYSNRYEIKDGELVLIEENDVVNMGISSSLEDFLLWGEENYPAEHRGVIFWDHGGGSMKGVCNDEQFYNDSLSLPEMQSAFATVYERSGRKYEFVGFDACLMATYDMACVLEPYANYMIASEELEPSTGWDYQTLLSQLGADTFYTDVLNAYATKQAAKETYTLSAIDLSGIQRANDVIYEITQQINYDVRFVGKALAEGKEFGTKGSGASGSNLFDLGLVAEALGIEYSFDGYISNVSGAVHADTTGMSFYFPTEQLELIEEYSAVCLNEDYIQFLNDYLNYKPEYPVGFVSPGYENNGCMSFTLTEDSEKYIQSVGYELHSYRDSEETRRLYCIGTDTDVGYEDGVYTVNFQGNWVFVNDILLHTNIYDVKEGHTVFATLVQIDGQMCQLLFTYFKQNQSFQIEGYVVESDLTSRIHSLTDGMEIAVIYEGQTYEGETYYHEEGRFVWGEDVEFSVKKVEPGYYQYIPYVVDIYGNVSHGLTATIYFDGEKSTMDSVAAG